MADTALLLEALHFAADKHRDQKRKDPEASPYINHPIAVAEVLARVGGVTDTVTLMAALLHDTIEDTDTKPDELEDRFGAEVRGVVMEVTDDKTLSKEARKQWQIDHAPFLSPRAKLVKIADKICNVIDVTHRPPAKWSLQRRREYLDWSTQVVAGCRGANGALERRFEEVVAEGWVQLRGG